MKYQRPLEIQRINFDEILIKWVGRFPCVAITYYVLLDGTQAMYVPSFSIDTNHDQQEFEAFIGL